MLWLAVVLFLSMAIAVLRGGRLTNLADIRLRGWPLLPLGFVMQALTGFMPTTAADGATLLILASYLVLILLVLLNRDRPGMWLAGVGILMNFSVIALNGGMPVLREAAQVAAGFTAEPVIGGTYKHLVLDQASRLPFLADVIPLRLAGHGQVISLGDVFLAVGLGRFLEAELHRPVRWFKHGVKTEGGSATRRG